MKRTEATFIETPKGIFTAAGNWFYITVDNLRSYAPGLFRKHSVEEIISDAEVWIRSPDSLSITLFMFTLLVAGIEVAVIVTVLFLPFWHLNKSAFINYPTTKLMRLIDKEAFLILLSIMVLSWMGMNENYTSLVVGLLFFLVLKFGGFRKLVDIYYQRQPHKIPLNDRILKMVVLKYAMHEDVNVDEVKKMETDVLNMISKNKK
ncbi:MAG: hypothetical protein WD491_07725 [Balneolales bacterium]